MTEDQVKEATRLYKRPLLERVAITKNTTTLPDYIRFVSEKVSGLFTQGIQNKERNLIV